MKKVSIIIPVYNCAEYLCECLNSVINQTFGIENIEVIIINDGSTDDSNNIINSYLKRYNDWIFINQENKGVSAARNIGLDICNCDYIMFLDSDDYLDKNAVQQLYDSVTKNNNIQMSIGRMQAIDEKGFVNYYTDKIINKNMVTKYSKYKKIINVIGPCSKLYRKKFIGKTRFILDVKHEDVYFSSYLILKNCLFSINKNITYYRRIRKSENISITQNLTLDTLNDLIINYHQLLEKIEYNFLFYLFVIRKINKYLYSKISKKFWKDGYIQIERFIYETCKRHTLNFVKFYSLIFSYICILYVSKLKRRE